MLESHNVLQMIWSEKALLRRQRTKCGDNQKEEHSHRGAASSMALCHLECSWNSVKVRCDEVRNRGRENSQEVRSEESRWGGEMT